jgi:flagellin-like protein
MASPTNEENAVSPTVGVILMVAVTVLLTATVGSYIIDSAEEIDSNPNAEVIFVQEANGNITVQSTEMQSADELKIFVNGKETNKSLREVGDTQTVSSGQVAVVGVLNDKEVLLQSFEPANERFVADFTFSPTVPEPDEQVDFDASSSSSGEYDWQFGDNTTAKGKQPSNRYSKSGAKNVTLTVKKDGASVNKTKTIIVNDKPTLDFTVSNPNPNTTDTVNFTGTANDLDGNITNYEWDFDDDGNGPSGENATNASHTFSQEGDFDVTLTVTDDRNTENSVSKTVDVNVVEPTAVFSVSPDAPTTSDTVTFNASNATDADGSITGYEWEFGDKNNDDSKIVTHSYASNGTFTVNLTVTDNEGGINTTSQNISINNTPPTAAFSFSPSSPVSTKDTITFDASGSNDIDGSLSSTAYDWEFGDGVKKNNSTFETTHSYSDGGDFIVNLTVTDADGATNKTNQTITVDAGPTVLFSFTPESPEVNETVSFDASDSTDSDSSIASYEWAFNDSSSTTDTGPQTSLSFESNGDYDAKVTVTNADGESNSLIKVVKVTGVSVGGDEITIG